MPGCSLGGRRPAVQIASHIAEQAGVESLWARAEGLPDESAR